MSGPGVPSGPPAVLEHVNGDKYAFDNWRKVEDMHLEGQDRKPGSVLIGWAAWLLALIGAGALYVSFTAQQRYVFAARHQDAASIIEALLLDLLMIVFTLLALGLSRAGKSSRTERALILACAAASAYMNVSAADTASPRSWPKRTLRPSRTCAARSTTCARCWNARTANSTRCTWSGATEAAPEACTATRIRTCWSPRNWSLRPSATRSGYGTGTRQ